MVKLSYSAKRDAIICPHKYELLYIRKIKGSLDFKNFLAATTVDNVFSRWIHEKFQHDWLWLENQAKSLYNKYANKVIFKSAFEYRDIWLKTREALYELMLSIKQCGFNRPEAISQKRVRIELDGVQLKGDPDLYFSDTLNIYDLKVTAYSKWLDESQLIFYHVILSAIYGRAAGKVGFLTPLMKNKIIHRDVTKNEWEKQIDEIKHVQKLIILNEFPATGDESRDCPKCAVRFACKRFRQKGNVNWKENKLSVTI